LIPLRSFRARVFAILLVVALVPVALTVGVGTWALGEFGATVGTLGPWDAVAESGQRLIAEAVRAAGEDPAVAAAADEHRVALSESVRRSRVWALLSGRVQTLLPLAAIIAVSTLALVALLAARWLSAGLARPIQELVGWTRRIAEGEPLPPASRDADRPGDEFAVLRRSLREMAGELAEARRRQIESERLRTWTEMARRVAHELKNPLTPMRMAATTLARREDPATSDAAEVLLDEIGRLEEMARTFSQFGRMPEGPAAEVDLGELARLLADRQGTPVRVRIADDAPRILGHYEVLSRAVRNLLANARDATAEAGGHRDAPELEVAAALLPGEGESRAGARITVRDRGSGVPPELLDTVWLPNVTTKRKGTGLGLAIVRQAAEAHGGSVSARNREDGGAEFTMLLPVAPGVEGDRAQAGGRPPSASARP